MITKELLGYIQNGIIAQQAEIIQEADSNSDKWYELFVVHDDGSTESVANGDTFTECFSHVEKFFRDYRFDRMNIDVWYDRDYPENGQGFFSPSVIYNLIREYLTNTEAIKKMEFYGYFEFNEIDKQCRFAPDYTVEGYIFKDDILFTFFYDLICYISEGEFEDADGENFTGSTYSDILKITNGIKKYARAIFEHTEWQHPSTIWEDWNNNGVLDEGFLTGEESKRILKFLLAGDGEQLVYQIVSDEKYLRKGYHQEGNIFIAFDNTSGNCNVEEFEYKEDALKWLLGDYESPEDFKGKTSAC